MIISPALYAHRLWKRMINNDEDLRGSLYGESENFAVFEIYRAGSGTTQTQGYYK